MHEGFGCLDSSEQTVPQWENIAIFGASINRIGFGAYYTITIVRNPYNPILIIKAPYIMCDPPGGPACSWAATWEVPKIWGTSLWGPYPTIYGTLLGSPSF